MAPEPYDLKIDVVPGVALALLGTFAVFLSSRITYTPSLAGDALGPEAVPMFLGAALIVVGAGICVRGVIIARKRRAVEEYVGERTDVAGTAAASTPAFDTGADTAPSGGAVLGGTAALACAGYYVVLPFLGFMVATPFLLVALGLVSDGASQWRKIVAFSLISTVAIYLFFVRLLGVRIAVWPTFFG